MFSSFYNKTNLFYSFTLACAVVAGVILYLGMWPQLKFKIDLPELFLISEILASLNRIGILLQIHLENGLSVYWFYFFLSMLVTNGPSPLSFFEYHHVGKQKLVSHQAGLFKSQTFVFSNFGTGKGLWAFLLFLKANWLEFGCSWS